MDKHSQELAVPQLNKLSTLLRKNQLQKKIDEVSIGIPVVAKDEEEMIPTAAVISSVRNPISEKEAELLNSTFDLKYAKQMTKGEFLLAFQMNTSGLFDERIEHYQTFSIEFMTKVLDKFLDMKKQHEEAKLLEQRQQAERIEEIQKAKTALENTNAILNEIALNYLEAIEGTEISHKTPFKTKFGVFLELVEFELKDEDSNALNEYSIAELIRKRQKRITDVVNDEKKLGEVISLRREISTLKKGRWSESTEIALKLIFEMELYRMQLTKLPPEFKAHVLEHIK